MLLSFEGMKFVFFGSERHVPAFPVWPCTKKRFVGTYFAIICVHPSSRLRTHIRPFVCPQVIFAMTSVLLKFGFLMAIVMLGFAISFYALFQGSSLSFGDVFLELFKAMLGEAGFFEFFEDGERFPVVAEHYRVVTTLLLVVYLFFITIMLLNLLIAILNTSHAAVQEDVHRAFKVSKARMIENYRFVVHKDLLPAPYNVVPVVVAPLIAVLPERLGEMAVDRATRNSNASLLLHRSFWRKAHDRAKNFVGRVAFWLVMGPLAVVGGQVLWAVSAPYAIYTWHKYYAIYRGQQQNLGGGGGGSSSGAGAAGVGGGSMGKDGQGEERRTLGVGSIALRWALLLAWCFLGAPLALAFQWVKASVQVFVPSAGKSFHDEANPGCARKPTVEAMLRRAPHGVGAEQLREFMESPMDDADVRRDEVGRVATMEHLKLLRDRLEATAGRELAALDRRLRRLESESAGNRERLESILEVVKKVA